MGYGNTKTYAKEFNDTIKNIIENENVEELKNISKDKNFYKIIQQQNILSLAFSFWKCF